MGTEINDSPGSRPIPITAFDADSELYARYRENYPDQMITDIVGLCPTTNLAVDCATGTGQVAQQLSSHFKKVIGIDQSVDQIAHAKKADNVEYRVESAEDLRGISDGSVDLITVATAIHWFDQEHFFVNARRVLKSGCLISIFSIGGPEFQKDKSAIAQFYNDYFSGYAPKNFKPMSSIKIPDGFTEVTESKSYTKKVDRAVEDVCGWVRTVSAWNALLDKNNAERALEQLHSRLTAVLDEHEHLEVVYNVPIRIFKKM